MQDFNIDEFDKWGVTSRAYKVMLIYTVMVIQAPLK